MWSPRVVVLIVVVVIAEMIAKSSWGKLENTVFIRMIDFCILHTQTPTVPDTYHLKNNLLLRFITVACFLTYNVKNIF